MEVQCRSLHNGRFRWLRECFCSRNRHVWIAVLNCNKRRRWGESRSEYPKGHYFYSPQSSSVIKGGGRHSALSLAQKLRLHLVCAQAISVANGITRVKQSCAFSFLHGLPHAKLSFSKIKI